MSLSPLRSFDCFQVEAADIEDFVHSWSRFACGNDAEQFIVGLRWAVFVIFNRCLLLFIEIVAGRVPLRSEHVDQAGGRRC